MPHRKIYPVESLATKAAILSGTLRNTEHLFVSCCVQRWLPKKLKGFNFVLCVANLTITFRFLRCSSRNVLGYPHPKYKQCFCWLFHWCERDTRRRNSFWFYFSNAETIEVSVHGHEVEATQKWNFISNFVQVLLHNPSYSSAKDLEFPLLNLVRSFTIPFPEINYIAIWLFVEGTISG